MLCLVASRDDESMDQVGRLIGARLRRAAKDRGWTQGQVHYRANAGQEEEIISQATVSALLRGAIANPGIGTVYAVARALDLTLDQVMGMKPMPVVEVTTPPADDVSARVDHLTDQVDKLGQMMRELMVLSAEDKVEVAEALRRVATDAGQSPSAGQRQPRKGDRKSS